VKPLTKSQRLAASVGLLLVSVAAVCAYQYHIRRPYHGIEKYGSAHTYSASATPGAGKDLLDAVPADLKSQVEGIEQGLKAKPDDYELLAKKVHLSIEYAPSAAIDACKRILQSDPNNHFALRHCAVAYMVQNDFEKALYYAGAAKKVNDTAEVHLLIGQIFYRKAGYDKALLHYKQALALDCGNAAALEAIQVIEKEGK
jgi:tetratricopeptide (TPR) repeat protein